MKNVGKDDEVSRTANGQKLSNALHQPQHDRLQEANK
jgi:hypothetical protein